MLLYPTATKPDPPPARDELQVGRCHMQTILLLTGEGKAGALPQTSKSSFTEKLLVCRTTSGRALTAPESQIRG